MIMVKKSTVLVMVIAVAFGLAWIFRASEAQDYATASGGQKIAVIDVVRVLRDSQENKDREKYSQQLNLKVRSEMEKLTREADEIRQELENALQPGSDEYKERLQEWFNKTALRESYEKAQTEILSSEAQLWTEALYQKLLDEVATVAQNEAISVVLGKDSSPIQSLKLSDLYTLIQRRKILYNSPFVDLTDKVLANMDRAYQRQKAGADEAAAVTK